MTAIDDRTCRACGRVPPETEIMLTASDSEGGPKQLGRICEPCWLKVARGGRVPRQTLEAILIYQLDPNVGGPDDYLDHEDYRDLELLGLWPEER